MPPDENKPTNEMLRAIGQQVSLIYKRQEEQGAVVGRVDAGVSSLTRRVVELNDAVGRVETKTVQLEMDVIAVKGDVLEIKNDARKHSLRLSKLETDTADARTVIQTASENASQIITAAATAAAGLVATAAAKAIDVLEESKAAALLAPVPGGNRSSIPPAVVTLAKKSLGSGSYTWDEHAMSTVMLGMRDQLDEVREQLAGYVQAHAIELALKAEAEKVALKAEKEAVKAGKKNARVLGWLKFTLAVILALGTAFAYVSKQMSDATSKETHEKKV